MNIPALLCLALTLAACSDFPEVGRAEAKLALAGSTPALLTGEELAALTAGADGTASSVQDSEAAALRARAAALRQR